MGIRRLAAPPAARRDADEARADAQRAEARAAAAESELRRRDVL
eukprot:gene9882-9638_t